MSKPLLPEVVARWSATAFLALGACSPIPAGPGGPPPATEASDQSAAAPAPFLEPALLGPGHREGRTVTVDLAARVARVALGPEQQAEMLTYNGVYPGPTLDVQEGDRLVVHFKNGLSEPTSVHWHGLHVPADQDDATETVGPGASRTYTFDIPSGSAGTYWYHPHLHGTVAPQVAKGLFGALRVRPSADPLPAAVGDSIVILSDLRQDASGRAMGPGEAERANGFEGETVLVNGRPTPELSLRPGETRRLRLVNAAASRYFRLAAQGQKLTLVATDGGYIERPTPLDELLLSPGERAEVLVTAPATGVVALQALPYDRGTTTATAPAAGGAHGAASHRRILQASHGLPDETATSPAPTASASMHGEMMSENARSLLTIRAEGTPVPDATLPQTLRSVPRLATGGAVARTISFSENHASSDFFINGKRFDPARIDIQAKLGATEVWTIENTGHMDHPFHLHGYGFQVLDRNDVAEPYMAWKDTVNVKPQEKVRFAIKYDRFPGTRVFHCHILDHEDLGMMGVFRVE